jgi:hypothetical protein
MTPKYKRANVIAASLVGLALRLLLILKFPVTDTLTPHSTLSCPGIG